MKKLLIFLMILFCFFLAEAQTKSVLFLGNSYTDVNNLPQLTYNVASSAGDTLIYDSNTPGGYTLQGHSSNQTSLTKIAQGNWDFVVLQDQSQRPSFPMSQVAVEVFPYAHILDSTIKANNHCGNSMFYMTWGRKNGDSYNCAAWPPVCTYNGMDSLLHMRYMMMADSNNAVVSPVGAVWKYIRYNYSSINLYDMDESHPSLAGSYAAACCFYTAIFRKDPSQISFNTTLNSTDAANIRAATKLVVFDSLLNWHIGEYDLFTDFSYTQLVGYSFQFNNLSQNATEQIWDFAGITDTSANPIYTFSSAGTYTVTLSSYDNCDTIISTKSITVIQTSLQENKIQNEFRIYPNPASDKVTVEHAFEEEISVNIFNVLGENLISIDNLSNNEIDVSSLESGIYLLQITNGNNSVIKKLLIHK